VVENLSGARLLGHPVYCELSHSSFVLSKHKTERECTSCSYRSAGRSMGSHLPWMS